MKKLENIMYFIFISLLVIIFVSCDDNDTKGQNQLPSLIVKKQTQGGTSEAIQTNTWAFSYDNSNRVAEIICSSVQSENQFEFKWKYNIKYSEDSKVQEVLQTYLNENDSRTPITYTYKYEGNTIQKRNEDILLETITIDSNERIVRWEQLDPISESSSIPYIMIYKYNDINNNVREETYLSSEYVYKYTYDDAKKGIFHTIKSPQWLLITLTGITNNYTSPVKTQSEGKVDESALLKGNYGYTFNSDNYPLEQIYTPIDPALNKNGYEMKINYIKTK
ncbi:MAG: hypothetical protein E6772_16060 [Dysgonomonas sp.]|nr:hypothetical protein [Dysgonomonas sp.]